MRFVVSFGSTEDPPPIVSVVFVPCPVFVFRGQQIQIHRRPNYEVGDFDQLLERNEELAADLQHLAPRYAAVMCHSEGHGGPSDLDALLHDLRAANVEIRGVFMVGDPGA